MVTWRGAGILNLFLGLGGFMFVVLGFDGHAKGTFYPWALAATVTGLVSLLLGWFLNRHRPRDNTHDFMGIPMQWWGGLFLVGGLGMFGAHYVLEGPSADEHGGASAGPSEHCSELSSLISECSDRGALMLAALCPQLPAATQESCLACFEAASDPCNPAGCQNACVPR